jgi:hypothetical protein
MAIITKSPKSRFHAIVMPMATAPVMQSQPENRETSVDRKDHRSNGWMEFGSIEMGVHAILRDKTNCPRVPYSTIPPEECSSLFRKSSRQRSSPKGPENEISAWDEGKNDGFSPVFSTQSWEFRNWNLLGKPLRPILKRHVEASDSREFASCWVVEPLLERFQKGNSHEIDSQSSEPFLQIQPSPGVYPR